MHHEQMSCRYFQFCAVAIILVAVGTGSVQGQSQDEKLGVRVRSEQSREGQMIIMDKCGGELNSKAQNCGLNTVDIMKDEPKPQRVKPETDGGERPSAVDAAGKTAKPVDMQTPIGDATLDKDGTTIIVNLRSTAAGENVSGVVRYPKESPHYKAVMDHLKGLSPGETKLVLPFEEKNKE